MIIGLTTLLVSTEQSVLFLVGPVYSKVLFPTYGVKNISLNDIYRQISQNKEGSKTLLTFTIIYI